MFKLQSSNADDTALWPLQGSTTTPTRHSSSILLTVVIDWVPVVYNFRSQTTMTAPSIITVFPVNEVVYCQKISFLWKPPLLSILKRVRVDTVRAFSTWCRNIMVASRAEAKEEPTMIEFRNAEACANFMIQRKKTAKEKFCRRGNIFADRMGWSKRNTLDVATVSEFGLHCPRGMFGRDERKPLLCQTVARMLFVKTEAFKRF